MTELLIICPLVFFAGLVDSIAGGGGIISLPAYVVSGLPYHVALGTNKLASTFGTTVSLMRFIKNKRVHWLAAASAVPSALIGSYLGAELALRISDIYLKYTLVIVLPMLAAFILCNKNFGGNHKPKAERAGKAFILAVSGMAGFFIGGYDGFFGPGTGTFLIIVFNTLLGLDILYASGTAKIVNWSSNVAALVAFLLSGSINPSLGIPAAFCSILGNYVGSGLALTKGIKIIRPMFVVVLTLLLLKIIRDTALGLSLTEIIFHREA